MAEFDVVILGAGAAGMMCAMEAGKRGRRVLLLDHADRAGKKILISGGGRSNFTNLHTRPENFISANPHFAKSALARFTPADMISLVEKHRIPYHEKTLGQLFCDRSSRDLVALLERECSEAGVRLQLETNILDVTPGRQALAGGFTVNTSSGRFEAESVVVATGGLSIPKMGATGFGYELAAKFGLKIVECRPGLVPFTFSAEERECWCDLSGVSAEVVASLPRPGSRSNKAPAFREKMLLTHKGLSGPSILQISSYWSGGEAVAIDMAPGHEVFSGLLEPKARRDAVAVFAALKAVLPTRWAERWLRVHLPQAGLIKDLTNASIAQLEQAFHQWLVTPAGTEGYAKAEVTAGGVDTSELDARTMESRRVPGLFFIGEVVDVTGWLGGYNFQWAWASGYSAGQVA